MSKYQTPNFPDAVSSVYAYAAVYSPLQSYAK